MSRRTRCALFRLVAEARSPTDLRQHKKSGSHIGARIFCAQDCLRPGFSVCGRVPQTLRLSPTPLQCTRSVWTEGWVLRASTTKGKTETTSAHLEPGLTIREQKNRRAQRRRYRATRITRGRRSASRTAGDHRAVRSHRRRVPLHGRRASRSGRWASAPRVRPPTDASLVHDRVLRRPRWR